MPGMTKAELPSFVITGMHRDTARRRTTLALRGCFFAQWRMQRSAVLHGHRPRPRAKVRDALNKRLRLAILRDWVRCYQQQGFERRWSPYITVDDANVGFINLPTLTRVGRSGD